MYSIMHDHFDPENLSIAQWKMKTITQQKNFMYQCVTNTIASCSKFTLVWSAWCLLARYFPLDLFSSFPVGASFSEFPPNFVVLFPHSPECVSGAARKK